jgi:eukaryotic-like serine/threonine-protein kinase
MDVLSHLTSALAGRYTIEREIGAGGMATVYLARDVRHDRRVALKVLNPELGAVLGVERFLSEIKVTANLQHPNLLPLFDSGEADGLLYYVMPFVEGESLRAKLQREKQFPVDEAVRIATAVASALAYAHAHGVIHRDLKPENILMQAGHPMVADFGIALAVSNAGGARITQTGLSLGTPQYMSPEQATGDRVIDGRTDIYSLGAMLYEMLSGDPPYLGGTSQAIIAKVLTEKPRSVRASRPNVPQHLELAVERALEKLPADRFATAQEFADSLSGRASLSMSVAAARSEVTAIRPDGTKVRRFSVLDVFLAGLVIVLGAFVGVQYRHVREARLDPVYRFQLVIPQQHVLNDASPGTSITISPRGDFIAYSANAPGTGGNLLWIRRMDQINVNAAITLGGGVRSPSISPDGRWVVFADGSDIKKVSVDGGPVVTIATIPDVPLGITWGSKGTIVVGSASSALHVINERGGILKTIPKREDEGSMRHPVFLPDGQEILYGSQPLASGNLQNMRIAILSLDDGKRTILDLPGVAPLGMMEGHILYVTLGGALMAAKYDGGSSTGAPVPVAQEILVDGVGSAKAALSQSGTLVYRSGKSESVALLIPGTSAPLIGEVRDYLNPRFSPDARKVAVTVIGPQGSDIWVFDRAKTTLTRVTTEGAARAEWTPDGKKIVFTSDRGGKAAFWTQPADGSGPAERLYEPPEGDPYEAIISPDNKWLVYRTGPGGKPARSVFAVELGKPEAKSIPIVASQAYIQMPRLSPNGKWLAYQSNESGDFDIYVRPFPGEGGRVQVSTGGGLEPLWSRTGDALFYRTGRDIIRAGVTSGESFSIGERKIVLNGDYLTNPSHPNYDVTPDGKQFLLIRRAGQEVQTIVVHNFRRELAARTAGNR